VAFVDLSASSLAPGVSPVRIRYRHAGAGPPIVFLHGGWGYEIYPFERQADALALQSRIVIPDRSGYGGSGSIETLPADFHHRAVEETRSVIDALGLERPLLWGHSDGAIIALLFALAAPDRVAGVVAEATHYLKRKPRSRAFFDTMLQNPASLGAGVIAALERDHGQRWPRVLELNARAWLRIADEASSDHEDLYGGRLHELAIPLLVVHGARDPRTEPGELDALRAALPPAAQFAILDAAGHSPHSEQATADEVTRLGEHFAGRVLLDPPRDAGSKGPGLRTNADASTFGEAQVDPEGLEGSPRRRVASARRGRERC
jgi:pimeloyl-ACP methyl ester carboxylesterase